MTPREQRKLLMDAANLLRRGADLRTEAHGMLGGPRIAHQTAAWLDATAADWPDMAAITSTQGRSTERRCALGLAEAILQRNTHLRERTP